MVKRTERRRTEERLRRIARAGEVGVMTWRRYKDVAAIVVPVDSDPARPAAPGKHPVTPAMAEAFEGRTGPRST
jgi:hypothetical protein